MDQHEKYMQRALDLALLGLGNTSPNPLVGCVIVKDGQIVGEGYHQKFGEPHAEVNAIKAVNDKSLLSGSSAYVTLEPCSHHGKTPPCADLLSQHKVSQVFIANGDRNPLVNGNGIRKLREAGIEVTTGVLEREGEWLNRRFFTSIQQGRPYVILKWAQTTDNFIARENFDSKWISNEYSRKLVHKWRTEEDAVLVGKNTALHDNPKLTTRNWYPNKNPIRVVIDKKLQLNKSHHLFADGNKTICLNCQIEGIEGSVTYLKVKDDSEFLKNCLAMLKVEGIQSVIVEGGSLLLNSFIEQKLWDEARVFTSLELFGKGIQAPSVEGQVIEETKLMEDSLCVSINTQMTWLKN